jgi:hypothetical protein
MNWKFDFSPETRDIFAVVGVGCRALTEPVEDVVWYEISCVGSSAGADSWRSCANPNLAPLPAQTLLGLNFKFSPHHCIAMLFCGNM